MPHEIRCRVDSGIHVALGDLPPGMRERLVRAVSVANPDFAKRRRLGMSTWRTPERLSFHHVQDGELRLPRGADAIVRDLAAQAGVPIIVEDERVVPTEDLPRLTSPPLRDYQAAAVEALVEATQGVFVLPTGAGKTRAAVGAIARLRTPTLILVGSRDLAAQWHQVIAKDLGLRAGLVAGGELEVAPVTVALAQALIRMPPAELDALLGCFGLLILDEAHSIGGRTFHQIVDRSPAKYRLGLTATPEREDGLTPLLGFYFAETLAQVTHAELAAAGYLLVPTVRQLRTGFDYPYTGAADYAPMLDALADDPARNQLIIDAVAAEVAGGQSCLVLSGRKDHCALLEHRLAAAGVRAATLTSRVAKSKRADRLEQARDGRMPVLVATSLADQGLDLPRLSRVFLAFPSKAQGRTIQRLGRILRPHPDKTDAVVIDVIDDRVAVLRRHASARRKAYEVVLGVRAMTQPRKAAA